MRSEQRPRRPVGDRGMATVELAACLPVLVLLLAAGLGLVGVVSGRVHAQDAAREAARASARGDPAAARWAQRIAPGAAIRIGRDGEDVTVHVRLTVQPFGGLLPAVTVTADAVAAREPGAPP